MRQRERQLARGGSCPLLLPHPFDRPHFPLLCMSFTRLLVSPASSPFSRTGSQGPTVPYWRNRAPLRPFPPPHAGGLPTPGSRHRNAPSVTTCPHHTDRKRLGQMERRLERGVGSWLGRCTLAQDDRSNRQVKVWIHAKVSFLKAALVTGWRRHGRTWRNGGQWRLSVGVAGPSLLPDSRQIWCQSEKRPPLKLGFS